MIAEQLEIDAKYDVYLSRQAADVAAYRRDEVLALPDQLDYAAIGGLSNEARQKLQAHRPRTIGHAGRIDGMTPAALTLVAAHVRRGARRAASRNERQPKGEGAERCQESRIKDRSGRPRAGAGADSRFT